MLLLLLLALELALELACLPMASPPEALGLAPVRVAVVECVNSIAFGAGATTPPS
jgi:hypothetical protein